MVADLLFFAVFLLGGLWIAANLGFEDGALGILGRGIPCSFGVSSRKRPLTI